MSNLYYYELSGETYQIEADSYRVSISGETSTFEITHDMQDGPIDYAFASPIQSFESLGGTWFFTQSDGSELACPADIDINGNRVFHEFDSLYDDNSGTCSYRVVIGTNCETTFYREGQAFKTVSVCGIVQSDPRNQGCSACCRELLPIVRSLRV